MSIMLLWIWGRSQWWWTFIQFIQILGDTYHINMVISLVAERWKYDEIWRNALLFFSPNPSETQVRREAVKILAKREWLAESDTWRQASSGDVHGSEQCGCSNFPMCFWCFCCCCCCCCCCCWWWWWWWWGFKVSNLIRWFRVSFNVTNSWLVAKSRDAQRLVYCLLQFVGIGRFLLPKVGLESISHIKKYWRLGSSLVVLHTCI